MATVFLLCCVTSCSNGFEADDSLISKQQYEVKLTFDFGLNARLTTRAIEERALESSDNWQRVNSMRVYLFRSDTELGSYTYYRPLMAGVAQDYLYVDGFSGKDADYTTEPFEEHEYLVSNLKLTAGWYKFLAIGRDDINGDDNTGSKLNLDALVEGTTILESVTASVASTSLACPEIFVNYDDLVPLHMDGSRDAFYKVIELKRAVAGVLMYVENIPSVIGTTDVKSMGIIRRQHTWALTLASPLPAGSASTPVAAPGATLVGQVPGAADYVLRYDLSSATVVNDYFVDLTPSNSTHPNSIVRGAFVTPQEAPTADCTLNLVLCDAGGSVLKAWDVKLVESNGLAVTPTKLYPIEANHIYCIGQRNVTDDVDQPIDLGELPADVIVVHGSWQADVNIEM